MQVHTLLEYFEGEFLEYFELEETEYLVFEEEVERLSACAEEFLERQREKFSEAVEAGENCDDVLAELQGDFEHEYGFTDELIELIDYDQILKIIHNFESEFNS